MTAIFGLLIGVALGAIARVSNFCSVGAVSDVMLARDTRRLRSWIMAAAVALLGTQILVAMDVFSVNRTIYRVPEIDWLPVAAGGIAFGFGMAQAGGCIQRALIRIGGGSVRSLATLLLVAFSATATIRFLIANGVVAKLGGHTLVHVHGFDEALAATGISLAASRLLLAVIISGALIAFCLKDRWFRESRSHLWGGAGIGLAIAAAWATASLQPFPKGVNLVIAAADMVTPFSAPFSYVGFNLGLVAGMTVGAFAVAAFEKDLMLDRFVDNDDIKRHVVGGILMGFGGALAHGCSFGQGLSGFSVLSFNAVIAIAAMVLGCIWGIRALEAGSAWGGLRLCFGRKAS